MADRLHRGEKASVELPVKCCGRCVHGRIVPDPTNLRKMIQCKAGPPSASFFPMQQGQAVGIALKSGWPVLEMTEECDAFESSGEPKGIAEIL